MLLYLSMRSSGERIGDVRRLVDAARALVVERSRHTAAIVESTGLSPAGVELALTRHLELDPTDDALRLLVDRAGDAPRVTLILSSNVFVGALRAVAFARAAAPEVVVRPSRRDPAFARALIERAADPAIRLATDVDVAAVDAGEIHVYGHDETIADVRRRARPSIRVRGHGAGMGVGWVSEAAALETSAARLADDVVVFDQRGCLSPRIVFVAGAAGRADAFADALHRALERLDVTVPRGSVPTDERAAGDRYAATMTYACRALVGTGHAIGIAPPGAPLFLPPPYRNVHIASAATLEGARTLLEPLRSSVVAVGADDLDAARVLAPPWARVSPLGEMQRPPLDGPVDLRDVA